MFTNCIIYEDNIFVSIDIIDSQYGISGEFKDNLAEGLRRFHIKIGYMEVIDVETILKKDRNKRKVIFYGLEDIATENLIWQIFATIKN